jgi:hypothetical protein
MSSLQQLDLVLLALAVPVFVLAGLPMLGLGVVCAAWLAQRGVKLAADRRAAGALASGDRRTALATTAIATLARLWMVTLPILLAGKLGEREDGLAAAVLAAILVTAHLGAQALDRVAPAPEAAP